jgi:formate hydrogenlyase transcriptional activator
MWKDSGKDLRRSGYARSAGRDYGGLPFDLEMLQAYPWPCNTRELQNMVERAVILTETDTFVVDESLLA